MIRLAGLVLILDVVRQSKGCRWDDVEQSISISTLVFVLVLSDVLVLVLVL